MNNKDLVREALKRMMERDNNIEDTVIEINFEATDIMDFLRMNHSILM